MTTQGLLPYQYQPEKSISSMTVLAGLPPYLDLAFAAGLYWHEKDLVVRSEFRDGNVPAQFENMRVLQETLDTLPAGVETVCFRSDTAAYQQELLRYCAEGKDERFGIIPFAVSAEAAHITMKEDFAGGVLPSGDFGENAAWWAIMILAYNLNSIMKRHALGEDWIGQADESDTLRLHKPAGARHETRETTGCAYRGGAPVPAASVAREGKNTRAGARAGLTLPAGGKHKKCWLCSQS